MSKIEPGRTISLSAMQKLQDPNFQDAIKEIIRIVNPLIDSNALIRSLFSEHDFQILEYGGFEITKIKKISTGEIFSKGDSFYHKTYKKVINYIHFDTYLTGQTIGNSYYISYVMGRGGLYKLHEIISMDKYNQMKDNGEL